MTSRTVGLAGVFLAACLLHGAHMAFAQDPPPPPASGMTFEDVRKKDLYEYKSTALRDPFLSIVKITEIQQGPEGGEGALPTQKYDLSQMEVMAILQDRGAGSYYAMVKMPDGEFYTIKKGMPLGLREGVVTDITLNKVVVFERVRNYKGVLMDQVVELTLKSRDIQWGKGKRKK